MLRSFKKRHCFRCQRVSWFGMLGSLEPHQKPPHYLVFIFERARQCSVFLFDVDSGFEFLQLLQYSIGHGRFTFEEHAI